MFCYFIGNNNNWFSRDGCWIHFWLDLCFIWKDLEVILFFIWIFCYLMRKFGKVKWSCIYNNSGQTKIGNAKVHIKKTIIKVSLHFLQIESLFSSYYWLVTLTPLLKIDLYLSRCHTLCFIFFPGTRIRHFNILFSCYHPWWSNFFNIVCNFVIVPLILF